MSPQEGYQGGKRASFRVNLIPKINKVCLIINFICIAQGYKVHMVMKHSGEKKVKSNHNA